MVQNHVFLENVNVMFIAVCVSSLWTNVEMNRIWFGVYYIYWYVISFFIEKYWLLSSGTLSHSPDHSVCYTMHESCCVQQKMQK